jgi:hypothetical protein
MAIQAHVQEQLEMAGYAAGRNGERGVNLAAWTIEERAAYRVGLKDGKEFYERRRRRASLRP